MNEWKEYNNTIIKALQEMYSESEVNKVIEYINKMDEILKKRFESMLPFLDKEKQYSDDYKLLTDLMIEEHAKYVRAVNAKAWAGCNWKNVE
jgi:hypothetical protein